MMTSHGVCDNRPVIDMTTMGFVAVLKALFKVADGKNDLEPQSQAPLFQDTAGLSIFTRCSVFFANEPKLRSQSTNPGSPIGSQ